MRYYRKTRSSNEAGYSSEVDRFCKGHGYLPQQKMSDCRDIGADPSKNQSSKTISERVSLSPYIIPLESTFKKKITRSPAQPCKYCQFGQVVEFSCNAWNTINVKNVHPHRDSNPLVRFSQA